MEGPRLAHKNPVMREAVLGVQPNWYHIERSLPYVERLDGGVSWAPAVWCNLEREPGVWDWDALDRIVRQAHSLHITMQFKIRVGSCWLTRYEPRFHTGFVTESEMPRDLHAYAGFVSAVVNRYAAQGVHTYAVENEPNTVYQWGGSITQLIRLTQVATSAIRRADPRALVADWGLSTGVYGDAVARRLLSLGRASQAVARYNQYYSTENHPSLVTSVGHLRATLGSGQDQRNLRYLQADESLLASGAFDVRQLHFYESAAVLPSVIRYLRSATSASVPIEVWELGRHVGRSARNLPGELVKSVCLLLAAGAREVNWLPLAAPSGETEQNFALLGAEGEPRPAGRIYQVLGELVARATSFRPLTLSGMSGLVMTRADRTMVVAWSDLPSMTELRLPAGSRVRALGGRLHRRGQLLEVGSLPVLIGVDRSLAALRARVGKP